jgi:hypothetical protein
MDSFAPMATETIVNMSSLTAVERYQWMRNREVGQTFGSRTIIARLDEVTFLRLVRPHLCWGHASSLAAYRARHPHATHIRLVQPQGRGPWQLEGVGSHAEVRPHGQQLQMFALKVTAFNAPPAIAWGRLADSNVYPIGSYRLERISQGREIPGQGDNRFFATPLRRISFAVGFFGVLGMFYGARSIRAAR